MTRTSFHERRSAERMRDPEVRAEYERARSEIEQVDSVVRSLDQLRESTGMSKTDLARRIGRNPSSIRRLFTAASNPELRIKIVDFRPEPEVLTEAKAATNGRRP